MAHGRDVIIKSPKRRRLFEEEAAVLKAVKHRRIPRLHDQGEIEAALTLP